MPIKRLRASKQKSTKRASESTESEEKVVMGGQKTRDVHFRAEITSKEFSRDREEDETSTEEIVIQHSNVIDVGLSRKTPGRLNITFVSPENSRISDERRAIRKSNVNDTFAADTSPGKGDEVDKMIKHIEEQIEAVKDQVEYVKSLTHPKRIGNTDVSISSNRTENVTDVKGMEPNRAFSFRAQYDTDSSNSSEVGTNHNKTNENISENTSTNSSGTPIANEEKEAHEENTSEYSKNKTVNIDKSKKRESAEVNDTHNGNEDNHRQDEASMSPNERDKAEDRENKTEVNNKSTATNLMAGISAEDKHDITE
ncbi:dentin sialophosphoprotein-like [Cydia pomonella]|nr:dentin sialophosphoprotein-like [Cydia pomonella]